MPLSDVEIRVLGALIEKERTTPEGYPLSLPALVTACNQLTNRDPVTTHHLQEIREAMQRLRDRGLATTIQEVSDRVPKHRHLLARALDLDATELALLAVLMLRGPQTAAEVRARTSRYAGVNEGGIEDALVRMSERTTPLVRRERAPGQAQERWRQMLGTEGRMQPRSREAAEAEGVTGEAGVGAADEVAAVVALAGTPSRQIAVLEGRVVELGARLAEVEARMAELEARAAAQAARSGHRDLGRMGDA